MTEQYLENEISELKARLKIVEDNLNGLIVMVGKLRSNTNDDINGTRQSVANITPYTKTQTAYIDDTEVVFENVPQGNLTVYSPVPCVANRVEDVVVVTFNAPLEEVTDITISIL